MSGPRGTYIYGSYWGGYWSNSNHAVRGQYLRRYAKKSLGLRDGPETTKLARMVGDYVNLKGAWYIVPFGRGDDRDSETTKQLCEKRARANDACNVSHYLSPEVIKTFCMDVLKMEEIVPTVIEVEKIVEIEVEVPLVLSFEERDILTAALYREQHATNALLRHAYEHDDEPTVRMLTGRITAIVEFMERLAISPDNWANGPAWLVDTNLTRLTEPQPEAEGLFAPQEFPDAV